ncbi:MAG: hypothetical protein BGO49_24825 [Planctomycetales bacterium 71-10]|nr:MAG: hypothetical protein BGO49_24825 [Planctomycetales bacterium 71-10]
MSDNIIEHDFTNHPVRDGASWLSIRLLLLRARFGRTLNRLRIPCFIRTCEVKTLNGGKLTVRANDLFLVISVEGCEYYFDRLTGKPAGMGVFLG